VLLVGGLLLVACSGDDTPSRSAQDSQPDTEPTRASSGPTASVQPRSGPPGSEIIVSGASWPPGSLIDVTGALPPGTRAEPYATTTTDQAGSFSVSFRLETTPDVQDLEVGHYNLVVRSASNAVNVPFLVETRRPIQNNGPGG
jgi:hypothetical protein